MTPLCPGSMPTDLVYFSRMATEVQEKHLYGWLYHLHYDREGILSRLLLQVVLQPCSYPVEELHIPGSIFHLLSMSAQLAAYI